MMTARERLRTVRERGDPMNAPVPLVLSNGKLSGAEVQPKEPGWRRGSAPLVTAFVISCAFLVVLVAAASLGFAALREQRAEHAVLVREIAVTIGERDDLLAARDRLSVERNALASERDGLIAERDRLSDERDGALATLDAERTRAGGLETSLQAANTRLSEAEAQVAKLRGEAETSAAEAQRLRAEVAHLRERADLSEADARATAAARARAQTIAEAALAYAAKGSDLSTTRDRMIDILMEAITAERNGRWADARQWMDRYDALVPLHNRQLDEAKDALEALRGLL
jgi:chromosome segregation ATPase